MICLSFIFYPFHWSFYLIITLLCLRMSFLLSVYYLLMQSYFLVTVSYQPFWEYQLEFFFFLSSFCSRAISVCSRTACFMSVSPSVSFVLQVSSPGRSCLVACLYLGWRAGGQRSRMLCGVLTAESRPPPQWRLPLRACWLAGFLLGRVGDPTNTRVCPTRRTPQRVLGVLLALLSLFIDIHFNCLWRREKAKANTHGLSLTSWTKTGFRRFGV